jgi:hypothetical protein
LWLGPYFFFVRLDFAALALVMAAAEDFDLPSLRNASYCAGFLIDFIFDAGTATSSDEQQHPDQRRQHSDHQQDRDHLGGTVHDCGTEQTTRFTGESSKLGENQPHDF